MKNLKGFTILELMIVIIIIGILAALAFPNFGPTRERTYEKEAKVNLKLIHAAQRIYRMENSFYYPYSGGSVGLSGINSYLKLAIPAPSNPAWNYTLTTTGFNAFSATAQRITNPSNWWCVDQNSDDPTQGSCP